MKAPSTEPKVLGRTGLPGVHESVSRARSEVRGWLGDAHPAVDDVVLAASELVTNAIRLGGGRDFPIDRVPAGREAGRPRLSVEG